MSSPPPTAKNPRCSRKDIVSRVDKRIAFEILPEETRKEISHRRIIAARIQKNKEASAADQRGIAEAKRTENESRTALKKAESDLALARKIAADADQFIRNFSVEDARLDARYDAARVELGSGVSSSYLGASAIGVSAQRSDYLRAIMSRAAEEKARLDLDKKDAEALFARSTESFHRLTLNTGALQKTYDTARAATLKAIDAARLAEAQRTAPD